MKDFKIDKSKWIKTKLFDLAEEISEREDNPGESEYDRFVGLEHFVSGDLKIKKWTTTEGLTSAAKVFKAGDVLFARRNAYLRRASMVDFDGLCSGDAFVLRENHKKIVPGFLSFILNSDKLWDFANANAAGTMSKRVKWRDLGNYEILLPPKDQQAKLAELLWAGDEVVEKYNLLLTNTEAFYNVKLEHSYKKNKESISIDRTGNVNSKSLSNSTPKDYEFRYLDIAGITAPKRIGELEKIIFENAPSRARRIVSDGDIVLSLVRPYFQSFVVVENGKDIISSTGTAVLSVNKEFNRDYVFHSFFTKKFLSFCEERMNGTNYPAITPNDLKDFKIPLLSKELQNRIAKELNEIDVSKLKIENLVLQSKQIQKQLINQIFS